LGSIGLYVRVVGTNFYGYVMFKFGCLGVLACSEKLKAFFSWVMLLG
jgi:hypothetical protein